MRRLLPLLLALTLVLTASPALAHEDTRDYSNPQESPYFNPDPDAPPLTSHPFCSRIMDLRIPSLNGSPNISDEDFARECPRIVPFFLIRGNSKYAGDYSVYSQDDPYYADTKYGDFTTAERDAVHGLFVVGCESGFRPDANTIRWGHLTGGKPEGLWAFMTHLRWPQRLLGETWGNTLDMMDTIDATFMATILIYGGVNTKVDSPNFWWWWSCARNYGPRFEAIFGYGTAPESRYCPPGSYWQRVPQGSNFICGGKNYG